MQIPAATDVAFIPDHTPGSSIWFQHSAALALRLTPVRRHQIALTLYHDHIVVRNNSEIFLYETAPWNSLTLEEMIDLHPHTIPLLQDGLDLALQHIHASAHERLE
jgi:hypothetical protein